MLQSERRQSHLSALINENTVITFTLMKGGSIGSKAANAADYVEVRPCV